MPGNGIMKRLSVISEGEVILISIAKFIHAGRVILRTLCIRAARLKLQLHIYAICFFFLTRTG